MTRKHSVEIIGRGRPSTARLTQPTDKIELFHLGPDRIFEKAAPLYLSGSSLREIARELGIPRSTIRKIFLDGGLVCRPNSYCRESNGHLLRRLHVGVAPYGYCVVHGKLLEPPKEQEVIRLIIKLRSAGRRLSGIAAYLNKQKIRPRKAKCWDHSTVNSILKRNFMKTGINVASVTTW